MDDALLHQTWPDEATDGGHFELFHFGRVDDDGRVDDILAGLLDGEPFLAESLIQIGVDFRQVRRQPHAVRKPLPVYNVLFYEIIIAFTRSE